MAGVNTPLKKAVVSMITAANVYQQDWHFVCYSFLSMSYFISWLVFVRIQCFLSVVLLC